MMLKLVSALVVGALAACDGARVAAQRNAVVGQDRLPPLSRESMTDAQKNAADRFAGARGQQPFGPFVPLLRSPELMLAAQSMGDYLRFKSPLAPRIREMAILLACRVWGQDYEWAVHYPLAIEAGLRRETAEAISTGRRPYVIDEEEDAAYELVFEILLNKRVSDATWRRAVQAFGEGGVVDLLGITGYYSFLAVVLNAARTPPPPGARLLSRFPG
jgi:4-carboxymuconolactone decarboxylase